MERHGIGLDGRQAGDLSGQGGLAWHGFNEVRLVLSPLPIRLRPADLARVSSVVPVSNSHALVGKLTDLRRRFVFGSSVAVGR